MIELSNSVESMSGDKGVSKVKSFTSITRDSLVLRIQSLMAITMELLSDKACTYVMLGNFETDPLESEFCNLQAIKWW